jgi:hypothetical protein
LRHQGGRFRQRGAIRDMNMLTQQINPASI